MTVPPIRSIRTALLSVHDKRGLVDFARALVGAGARLLASGGTARALADAGIACTEVGAYTGAPEMLGGRVKTLHPAIHGGILARDDQEAELAGRGLAPIDLVAIDLYPFEAAWRDGKRGLDLIEMIDVGGPAMLRAAAKNSARVTAVGSPDDYPRVVAELARHGGTTPALRGELARAAFARVSAYDRAIADALTREAGGDPGGSPRTALRYGENPHQAAELVRPAGAAGTAGLVQLSGEGLSYTNFLDLDAGLRILLDLGAGSARAACVLKHATPCGAGVGTTLVEAFRRAHRGDPLSAYGGLCGLSARLDLETARALTAKECWFEIVLAPSVAPDALATITAGPRWGKRVRILVAGADATSFPAPAPWRDVRGLVGGGRLEQDADAGARLPEPLVSATSVAVPTERVADFDLAWRIVAHIKSNAIALVRDGALVGMGGGQPSRVDAVELACKKAGDRARGAILASDAFFPFSDGLATAIRAGIAGAIQPAGSRRDEEVIAAAEAARIPLVMADRRHFRH